MEATLIDYMGSDLRVVNAARVSFKKESDWEIVDDWIDGPDGQIEHGEIIQVNDLSEKDQKLITYLAKHNHWTPFSHVQITLREKIPIFVARQRFKHMVGFTYNEVSRRYVDDAPEFFKPDAWRSRPEGSVKQGSGDKEIGFTGDAYIRKDGSGSFMGYNHLMKVIQATYEGMLEMGIAPEQARMVLPQAMYTEYYVTGSLPAWARAYKLRIDPHAQKEIQDLAKMWDKVIGGIDELRYSWKALTE